MLEGRRIFFNVFDFGKSNLNTLSQCGIKMTQLGNLNRSQKSCLLSLSRAHTSHRYTHTEGGEGGGHEQVSS